MLKLWLDDVRPAPDSTWTTARTAREAIALLDEAVIRDTVVEAVSLDHDLGAKPEDGIYARGTSEETGQLVADYLASLPDERKPQCPITIHSWNSSRALSMAHVLSAADYRVSLRPYRIPAIEGF